MADDVIYWIAVALGIVFGLSIIIAFGVSALEGILNFIGRLRWRMRKKRLRRKIIQRQYLNDEK